MGVAGTKHKGPIALKCSNCGAPLRVDPHDHEDVVTCEYCGTSFAVADLMGEDHNAPASRPAKPAKERASVMGVLARSLGAIMIVVCFFTVVACLSDAFTGSTASPEREYSTVAWSDIVLGDQLPKMGDPTAYVYENGTDRLDMRCADFDQDAFDTYVSNCKEMGYTVEPTIGDGSYEAFNEAGYHLRLYLYEGDGELNLELEAPKPMSPIMWPQNTPARTIPQPEATQAYIENASNDYFVVYVDGMSRDAVKAYMQTCLDAGYTEEYSGDDYLNATDADGNHLSVRYEGNNVMYVTVYGTD